ncbi:hypothetical protein Taro_031077 [Colocasia esculenta]|uniref:Uncharacterized protein n=1 Tax=Colocasia esculenta TaxID=4460 RepID=A0A843VHZ0_COLES|nr:hypothetical protein [Colocasia esculenta]
MAAAAVSDSPGTSLGPRRSVIVPLPPAFPRFPLHFCRSPPSPSPVRDLGFLSYIRARKNRNILLPPTVVGSRGEAGLFLASAFSTMNARDVTLVCASAGLGAFASAVTFRFISAYFRKPSSGGDDCSASTSNSDGSLEHRPGPDPFDPSKRIGYLSWDDYFMAIAFLSAKRSKDPNRQIVNFISTPPSLVPPVVFIIL